MAIMIMLRIAGATDYVCLNKISTFTKTPNFREFQQVPLLPAIHSMLRVTHVLVLGRFYLQYPGAAQAFNFCNARSRLEGMVQLKDL